MTTNRIVIVTGFPRSGTTITADRIRAILSDSRSDVRIYDELNPFRFVDGSETYYSHLRHRSLLKRPTTINERPERFNKKKQEFDELNLDYHSRFSALFFRSAIPVIKYPSILENQKFIKNLIKLLDAGVTINIVYCVREKSELKASFRRRNLYFFNTLIGRLIIEKWIKFEVDLIKLLKNVTVSIDSTDECLMETLDISIDRNKLQALLHLNNRYRQFYSTLQIYKRVTVFLRKKVFKRSYW